VIIFAALYFSALHGGIAGVEGASSKEIDMDIRERLNSLAAAPKNWKAVAFMPNGDVRTFAAISEGAAKSWLDRLVDRHGVDGYVECMA
jgi:hypothetical protein